VNVVAEILPGCHLLETKRFEDHRGDFVKTFHASDFVTLGLPSSWREEFYSTSRKNVLRGMHFQTPPFHHDKLVYCIRGRVLDVVVDLRHGTNFGVAAAVELSAENHRVLYIPKGIAHGFLALEDDSMMVYKTTAEHEPAHDAGILWNSFGFEWPVNAPVISSRDEGFPSLNQFSSPF